MDLGKTLANAGRKIGQGVTNFIGGVNDTMNYPTVGIGQLGSFLTRKGTPANNFFQDLRDSARQASDMGQNRKSAGYMLGRMAPGAAVTLPMMVASSPAAIAALPATSALGMEAAGISTLAYPADMAPSFNYQDKLNAERQAQANQERKRQIFNSFARWQSQGINFNDPRISPLIIKLMQEYKSL